MPALDQLLEQASIDHAARVFEDFFLRIASSDIQLGSAEFRVEVERAVVEITDGLE